MTATDTLTRQVEAWANALDSATAAHVRAMRSGDAAWERRAARIVRHTEAVYEGKVAALNGVGA